jgi:Kef-type K+ transport system membrane component KefB
MDNLITVVIGDVALVLVVSSLAGAAARRCGQPAVIGQILAGILFGPSFLGRLPGHLTNRLFPHAALPYLTVMSQVAVVLFMFVVGYELDRTTFRRTCRAALLVAAAALVVPMALGSGTAIVFRSEFAALGQSSSSHSFILFMGVATSITALPVLAAIMRERGISGTTAAVTATAAAGIMDVAAWIVLAAALTGTAGGSPRPWPVTLMLITGFAIFMLLAVRPALRWWFQRPRAVLASQLPVALALALGSACVTAALGLHPVFGGLLAGLTMPGRHGKPDPDVRGPMESLSSALLPLFFVVTGLSVNVGALGVNAIAVLALLLTVAIAGKMGPAYASARIGGLTSEDAATVAVLVNARGLTELIVLNIGLSTGLIGQRLFTVLVLMAVLATLMTAPLLALRQRARTSHSAARPERESKAAIRIP